MSINKIPQEQKDAILNAHKQYINTLNEKKAETKKGLQAPTPPANKKKK